MEIINAIGRRKTSVARVFIRKGNGIITVNNKTCTDYFPIAELQYKIRLPLNITEMENKIDITANIQGGGVKGQAEALVLGISRALCKLNPDYRPALKSKGLMKRDPRMVERKKPGQKKARKRFQFSKR
jgi:small subunit ribosomal protein S9